MIHQHEAHGEQHTHQYTHTMYKPIHIHTQKHTTNTPPGLKRHMHMTRVLQSVQQGRAVRGRPRCVWVLVDGMYVVDVVDVEVYVGRTMVGDTGDECDHMHVYILQRVTLSTLLFVPSHPSLSHPPFSFSHKNTTHCPPYRISQAPTTHATYTQSTILPSHTISS